MSLTGWSIQYASATGTGTFGSNGAMITPLPDVTLAPGQYLLVQEAPGANPIGALPSPYVTDFSPIAMSGTSGKVALVNDSAPLLCNGSPTPCGPAQVAKIVDLVGYGGASFSEGAPTAVLGNATAAIRKGGGCTETDNNSADFAVGTPAPRTANSPLNPCECRSCAHAAVRYRQRDAVISVPGRHRPPERRRDAGDQPRQHRLGGHCGPHGNRWRCRPGVSRRRSELRRYHETFSIDAVVDASVAAGPKTLPATITDAQGASVSTTIALTISGVYTIHTIQGAGDASPLAGQRLKTAGIVTAIRRSGSVGFFIQATPEDVDSDPATSEGIFVYMGGAALPAVGDLGERHRHRAGVPRTDRVVQLAAGGRHRLRPACAGSGHRWRHR